MSHTKPSDSYQGNDVQPVGPVPLPVHTPPSLCFYMSSVFRSQGTVVSLWTRGRVVFPRRRFIDLLIPRGSWYTFNNVTSTQKVSKGYKMCLIRSSSPCGYHTNCSLCWLNRSEGGTIYGLPHVVWHHNRICEAGPQRTRPSKRRRLNTFTNQDSCQNNVTIIPDCKYNNSSFCPKYL